MTRIVTIVGARPQFVKAAVLSRLVRTRPWAELASEFLVHTGQHYDATMSDLFFSEMRIPRPDVNLGIGGGSHGSMTGEMLEKIEAILLERKPDLVLVYGDTNSTLAGALAASKLGIPVAHVEAGLRSYSKRMPEEQNRIVVDHLSAWLLCPTSTAVRNLSREGITDAPAGAGSPTSDRPRVLESGDVMYDASVYYRGLASARSPADRILGRLALDAGFRLLTLHRAENTDDPYRLAAIFSGLAAADDRPIVFPVHPRTKKRMTELGVDLAPHILAIEPVGYYDMLELEEASSQILTDSGGVQKEAYFFGKPCITLRDQTEWVETLDAGWNRLVGADPAVISAALRAPAPRGERPLLYGAGDAGERILAAIIG